MDLRTFTKLFEESIDEVKKDSLTPETEFKTIEQWDSLANLNILSMIDAEFNRTISSDELIKLNTIQDVYNFINSK